MMLIHQFILVMRRSTRCGGHFEFGYKKPIRHKCEFMSKGLAFGLMQDLILYIDNALIRIVNAYVSHFNFIKIINLHIYSFAI